MWQRAVNDAARRARACGGLATSEPIRREVANARAGEGCPGIPADSSPADHGGSPPQLPGPGIQPDEQATVSVEDAQGHTEASFDPATISKDGNLDELSLVLPDSIGRGDHVLHVVGNTSSRSARAKFSVASVSPKIVMDTYSVKSSHTFGFSGSGFAPGEIVDVRLGGLGGAPSVSPARTSCLVTRSTSTSTAEMASRCCGLPPMPTDRSWSKPHSNYQICCMVTTSCYLSAIRVTHTSAQNSWFYRSVQDSS